MVILAQALQNKLIVRFGVPEHGWLPVYVKADDFELELDVSDVPVNPLEELCSALTLVLQGASAEVSWHLEPDWYYFQFDHNDELITLTISEYSYNVPGRTEIIRLTGSIALVVLPFYRALKSLVIPGEEAWPAIEQAKLDKLTMLLKNERK
jgi:hypothetical protein